MPNQFTPITFERSFASHEKARYWHPTLNGNLIPIDFSITSGKKCWFKCDKCFHDFESSIANITTGNHWCIYCAGQKLCGVIDCNFCFNKSFAPHEKSKFWHPTLNGNLMPYNVSLNSHKKHWFKCGECSHAFDTRLDKINGGNWCPYCNSHKLCGVIDCNFCFNKSFAIYSRAKDWHPKKNGNLMPINVSLNSNKKYWFKCDKCSHDFYSVVNQISSGTWCPVCKNKTEKKLFEFLVNEYPNRVKHNIRYNWCKNPNTNCHFPYDFEVFEKIIIELDGDQHIDREVSNWGSLEEHQERDMYKMEKAINNGKHIIRILQRDVWNDKNDWKEKLKQEILLLKDDVDMKIRCIGECNVYREYTIEYY
tara:strand:- start:807 stop:1901 length:1095 start_codon:yes stop_codon:yes gene_type:complete